MGRWMRKIKNKEYGQAMVEFALTLPIFLLLVFGVIELSRFFLVYSSVYTASREATRFGASVGEGETTNYMNCTEIIQTATRMGNFGGVQTNDVTVYFESSPGIFAGTCDESLDYVDRYLPKLGDRLVVEIETEFVSLLGIVPNLPVRAANGRTIMKSIVIERTPVPVYIDKCEEKVSQVSSLPTYKESGLNGEGFLSMEINNISTISTYTISGIKNISWIGTPLLSEVWWKFEKESEEFDYLIWKSDSGIPAPGEVALNLPILESVEDDYWNMYLRNLYPGITGELKFIFENAIGETLTDKETLEGILLDFDVYMNHTNYPADTYACNPVPTPD